MELTLREISMSFEGMPVLHPISLILHEGVTAILGPNGAGKTTLMRIIATVLEPDGGTIRYNGLQGETALAAIRSQAGYLPQSLELPRYLTPRHLLRYAAGLKRLRIQEKDILGLLEKLGLGKLIDQPLARLSDGQRRLVAMAQAFLGWPKLVLLDEFSAGLDVEEKEAAYRLINAIKPDTMVVITSNLPAEVEKIAQSLIILREGELQFSGIPAELVDQAQGKVWEVLLPENGPISIIELHNLSRLRQLNDGTMLRIVGKAPDLPGIQPVEPTLEDAYMLSMLKAKS